MDLIGISGSLRRASYNTALLRAAVELAPPECRIEPVTLHGIPLYDGDVEAAGIPAPVARLKDRIAASDGLILVTPEYNASLPGVLKNAVDWLTRPAGDIPRVFRDRPVAMMGATPGTRGTQLAQAAWLPVMRALGVRLWFGRQLNVAGAGSLVNEAGELSDPAIRERLREFLAGFAAFVAAEKVQS
jgi:NAD(P)H-dependent FMN reductase